MSGSVFTIRRRENFFKVAAAWCLLLALVGNSAAQYRGAPVKKDRLVNVLRSKQLQTADIVTIINRNGVDFRLTAETRNALISAGARPEVIRAVSGNLRAPLRNETVTARAGSGRSRRIKPAAPPDYEDLLSRAIASYKERGNAPGAVRILETAVRAKPENPAAYQMLGFVYLYGLNDLAQAEKSLRESFVKGGSAVFRVFHDDNGKFTKRCTGSLYISRDTMRFESDDNVHTFETSAVNIDKIKLDTESTRFWKKHSVFKVFLKFGKEEAKFRFAPLTGAQEESKMVERFIASSNARKTSADSE